jgi:hypothetical protein
VIAPLLLGFASLTAGESCPALADVEQRVRTILHLSPERELSETFVVERHEAGLYVVLQAADATLIGERTLPSEGSCDELAQAAAVVLSAWLTDVHPDFAGSLPNPAPDLSLAPPAAAPAPAPTPVPVSPPPPPPPPSLSASPGSPPLKARHPASHRIGFALAVGVTASGGKAALSGLLGAGWLPRASGLGVSGFAQVDGVRHASLGNGAVAWRRWPLAIGPTLRLRSSRVAWELSLAPTLAWVRLTGERFERNLAKRGFTLGGLAQLQASSVGRHWTTFAAVNTQIYFGNTEAYAGPLSYTLPAVVMGAFVGGRWSP